MRKKLRKLLNKELIYTGIVGVRSHDKNTVCIEDVKHEGKKICCHVWVSNVKSILPHEKGTQVSFSGTATTYRDKQKVRKNGINQCHDFKVNNESYRKLIEEDQINLKRRNY